MKHGDSICCKAGCGGQIVIKRFLKECIRTEKLASVELCRCVAPSQAPSTNCTGKSPKPSLKRSLRNGTPKNNSVASTGSRNRRRLSGEGCVSVSPGNSRVLRDRSHREAVDRSAKRMRISGGLSLVVRTHRVVQNVIGDGLAECISVHAGVPPVNAAEHACIGDLCRRSGEARE